jgi:HD-GYP domain-containing protein (c-di-GMP phosphodiesterase class II)
VHSFADVIGLYTGQHTLSSAWTTSVEVDHDGRQTALVLSFHRARVGVVDAGAPLPERCDTLVVVGAGDDLESALEAIGNDRVHLLPLPISSAAAQRVLDSAVEGALDHGRARMGEQLVHVGMSFATERNPAVLLEVILREARAITGADAGSIYAVEKGEEGQAYLRFANAQNDSVELDLIEFTMPITEDSIVGAAVLAKRAINIENLYDAEQSMAGTLYHHDRSIDTRMGYETRSMLTVPMVNPEGQVLGAIQLINARHGDQPLVKTRDFEERVFAFEEEAERVALALAGQGAVALENARLYDEIQRLFEGFVRASVTAIEQRDPTTSGHSQRVADLSVALARVVDQHGEGHLQPVRFSKEQLRELEYAALLHDFGKVGVREDVLVKAKKLYPAQRELVMHRFEHMRTTLRVRLLEAQLERMRNGSEDTADIEAGFAADVARLDDLREAVLEANEPALLAEEGENLIQLIADERFVDTRGNEHLLLNSDEVQALLIKKGSLTEDERLEIQSHVTHTYSFLSRIPWGSDLARVPEIASKHHEYLNGTGYPHRIPADGISVQTRMMTISDIFDALTASDRPYKRAVPLPRALDILQMEVKAGKVDGVLLEIFVRGRVFEEIGLHLP